MLHWGGLGPLKSLWIYQPTQLTSVFSAGPRKPWNILTRILLFSSALMIHWRSRPWNKTSWLVRREGVFFCQKKLEMVGQIFFSKTRSMLFMEFWVVPFASVKVKAFRTAKCDSNFLENISSTGFIVETGINDSIVAFDAFLFGVIWQILPAMRYTTPWVPFFFVRNFNSMPLESLGWCFSVVFSFLADFSGWVKKIVSPKVVKLNTPRRVTHPKTSFTNRLSKPGFYFIVGDRQGDKFGVRCWRVML